MIPNDLERAIRRAHRDGRYATLDLNSLDRHLSTETVRRIGQELNGNVLVHAEILPPEPDYDRSFTCYVSRRSGPGWLEFNRSLDSEERLLAVRESNSDLVYWIIQLSRLGPFWCGYWNRFRELNNQVVAETVPFPEDHEWRSIDEYVRDVMRRNRFTEIDGSVLAEPVQWLEAGGVSTLRSTDVGGTAPTVYECMFSEVY